MQYSTERKEAVFRKMVPPHNRSIKQLAREEGISEATLFTNPVIIIWTLLKNIATLRMTKKGSYYFRKFL